MSLGKLQAALTAATNEVTVAAANINFDFTLIKCEAPKEYHDLGNSLSTKRKEDAEKGQLHVTARRLGALFEGVCDPSPNLIRAYGHRVSEIASSTQQDSAKFKDSFLSQHAGIDGTSIWAAATSSQSALHVQLLACMLARLWTAAEATSVWYEMVKERRRDIARAFEETGECRFASIAAAVQSDISRASLAEWDASARAWLQTADRVKRSNQDQLMLIIANVNIQINNHMDVYDSVKIAWRSAVESMEKLVNGMPQAANSGPILLALSAWHLYPDIIATGRKCVEAKFQDGLVQSGGILTVGLTPSDNTEARGVYWSLSLAHLNYYGRPVHRERHVHPVAERLSFTQFSFTVLGALLGNWAAAGGNMYEGANLLVAMRESMERFTQSETCDNGQKIEALNFTRNSSEWRNVLAAAAQSWLECDPEKDDAHKLVQLGARRSNKFLPNSSMISELYFGFNDSRTIVEALMSVEDRIDYLRKVALSPGTSTISPHCPVIIRYVSDAGKIEYTTVVPISYASSKRKLNASGALQEKIHVRWTNGGYNSSTNPFRGTETVIWQDNLFQEYRDEYGRSNDAFCLVWNEQKRTMDPYRLVFGAPVAGIYYSVEAVPLILRQPTIRDFISYLEQDRLSPVHVLRALKNDRNLHKELNQNLHAVSLISKLLKVIPSARISVHTLDSALSTKAWFQQFITKQDKFMDPMEFLPIDRSTAISCIAYLVAGKDISPSATKEVFAMAYEDSLYVDMQLLCDPGSDTQPYELKHVIGNVGRPGLTLMIPPKNPIVRPLASSSWKVIANNPFNGRKEDHFDRTTMHLSFTEYYRSAHLTGDQGQDSQVFFLESVVSVHDGGEWIGDIDIENTLTNRNSITMRQESCKHIDGANAPVSFPDTISLECWSDILDLPSGPAVVRAHDNWLARLAVVGILQTLKVGDGDKDIRICPHNYCWRCHDIVAAASAASAVPAGIRILPKLYIY